MSQCFSIGLGSLKRRGGGSIGGIEEVGGLGEGGGGIWTGWRFWICEGCARCGFSKIGRRDFFGSLDFVCQVCWKAAVQTFFSKRGVQGEGAFL